MTRSRQIIAVYTELRRSFGGAFSPRQLMACAASLVELFRGSGEEPAFELRVGGVPFYRWAVDRAIADGGWRILAIERCGELEPDEDEMDLIDARRLLSTIETEVFA